MLLEACALQREIYLHNRRRSHLSYDYHDDDLVRVIINHTFF